VTESRARGYAYYVAKSSEDRTCHDPKAGHSRVLRPADLEGIPPPPDGNGIRKSKCYDEALRTALGGNVSSNAIRRIRPGAIRMQYQCDAMRYDAM
jgi:hypothetical protein